MRKSILFGATVLSLCGFASLLGNRIPDQVNAAAADSCIYIITGNGADWSSRYVYGYGESEGFGAFPGKLVKNVANVTKAANFGGGSDVYWNGGIYKLEYSSSWGMTNIIFNNGNFGSGNQTADIALTNGACYFYNGSNGYHYRPDLGKAARTVFDFDNAIGAVNTICSGEGAFAGLSDSEKCDIFAPLYSEYLDAIYSAETDEPKGWLNDSKLTTGNHGLGWLATTVFKDVLDRNGYTFDEQGHYEVPEPAKVLTSAFSGDSSAWLIVGAISMTSIIATGAFIWHKRKAE